MLDIFYESLAAFQADCLLCGLDAETLLSTGEYILRDDGTVIAKD